MILFGQEHTILLEINLTKQNQLLWMRQGMYLLPEEVIRDVNDTIDNNDIVTIKYNTGGTQMWIQRYNGTGNLRTNRPKYCWTIPAMSLSVEEWKTK